VLQRRDPIAKVLPDTRKVDVRLPGKGNPNSHGARPVYLIITMIKWIRTSRLSIRNSLSARCACLAAAPQPLNLEFGLAKLVSRIVAISISKCAVVRTRRIEAICISKCGGGANDGCAQVAPSVAAGGTALNWKFPPCLCGKCCLTWSNNCLICEETTAFPGGE